MLTLPLRSTIYELSTFPIQKYRPMTLAVRLSILIVHGRPFLPVRRIDICETGTRTKPIVACTIGGDWRLNVALTNDWPSSWFFISARTGHVCNLIARLTRTRPTTAHRLT
jgi:hypothetical protein